MKTLLIPVGLVGAGLLVYYLKNQAAMRQAAVEFEEARRQSEAAIAAGATRVTPIANGGAAPVAGFGCYCR